MTIDKEIKTLNSSNWALFRIILGSHKIWKNRNRLSSSNSNNSNSSYLVTYSLTNIIDGGYSNTVMNNNGNRGGDNHISLNDI